MLDFKKFTLLPMVFLHNDIKNKQFVDFNST